MMRQSRTGFRIPVQLPIKVRWKSHSGNYRQVHGKTGNISGNGLFITVPLRPTRSTPITMTVQLPVEVTHSPLKLFCMGRVVRWNREGEQLGVGAVIDAYELQPTHRLV
jgi:hypothetical protein